ncbi:MAG: U32 family peptidase [Draconibacterium sp.]
MEYFVHGALCVSLSGQCYFSEVTTGRSANRGMCTQACRHPYNSCFSAFQVGQFNVQHYGSEEQLPSELFFPHVGIK